MAEGVDEDDFYKRVVDAIRQRFVSDADPVAILDVLLEKEYIDHDQYRDISELRLTSEKNRQIIETVRSKGKTGYTRFKDYLRNNFHEHIVEYMERKEKEIKPRRKTTRIQIPRNLRRISDHDLMFLGSTIGRNWELLGPLLGLPNVEIDRLKMNYATVELQIYNMLLKWKQNVSVDGSSLEELMLILRKAPTSIHIDYDCINRHFQRASDDVHSVSKRTPSEPGRATGLVEQPMLTHSYSTNTSREHETTKYQSLPPPNGLSQDKDDQASSKFQETRSNDMLCKTFPVDQVDASKTISVIPVTSKNFNNLDTTFKDIYSENRPDMENENRPVQEHNVSNRLKGVIDELHNIALTSSMQVTQYSSSQLCANVQMSDKIKVDFPEASMVDQSLEEKFKFGQDKPIRKCFHDGRLLILDKTHCEQLKKQCDKTMKGGFGSVYLTAEKIPPINIKIALKEIKCDDNNKHYKRSITNEQLASRVMHFAIVPLLGMGVDQGTGINWFLAPRLDKGDLYTLIDEDTKRIEEDSEEKIQLTHKRRLKILYHIAAAIHFLHTEITHFRGSVIHLDVKTRNVVLDGNYNARLTDFGVARETPANKDLIETSQTAIPVSEGYFETPVLGQLHKYFDYFNIGVVILELLTGKPPLFYESGKEVMLKNLDDDCIDFYIQDEIWNDNAPVGKRLKQLLRVCMDSAKGGDSLIKEKSTSVYILEESQKLIEHCGGMTWERVASLPLDHDKCEMCMVNPSVPNDLFSHQNCLHPLYVCVSCMRNSYLNPLLCHSCLQEIDPLIGSKSGAVLVAGQYDNEKLTDLCAENVRAVEETITSKCPLVMGIRPDNVKRLPSLEVHLSPADQIRKAYSEFKEKGLKTVFFYFSGRYSKKTGFVLRTKIGESDIQSRDRDDHRNNMALSEFKEILQSFLDDTESDDKVIVILDCQEAPLLNFDETKTKMKIVQLNSCKPDQKHNQDARCKSLFTKAFLQGLKATSKNDCDLHEDGKPCTICPIEGQDFITIGNMNTYISRHMVLLEGETAKPVQNATSDMKIAYLVDSSDKLSFTLTFEGKLKDCEIACSYFNNINQLKEVLFDKFMEQMKVDKEKGGLLELKANEFCHILGIFYKRGPKDSHKEELFTLEQVMSAWNGKRQLHVEMREMSTIDKGMVGVFRYEKNKNYFLFIENCEYGMDDEDTDKTVFKIDIETFIAKNKKTNMKKLSLELNKIRVAVRPAELHIVKPVVTDEHGTRHQRDDFLCYKIERLSKM